jgi:hypothetical protein
MLIHIYICEDTASGFIVKKKKIFVMYNIGVEYVVTRTTLTIDKPKKKNG